VAPACDLGVLGPAEHDLDRLPAAADQAAADARLRAHAAERLEFAAQRLGHFGRRLFALVPVLEEHDHVAGVHFLARAPAAGHAGVVAADGAVAAVVDATGEDALDLLDLFDGVVVAGAFRAHDRHEERATVFR